MSSKQVYSTRITGTESSLCLSLKTVYTVNLRNALFTFIPQILQSAAQNLVAMAVLYKICRNPYTVTTHGEQCLHYHNIE